MLVRAPQVVSPVLVERAHHFGSKLALKDEWVCVDPPYFSAPGAPCPLLALLRHLSSSTVFLFLPTPLVFRHA